MTFTVTYRGADGALVTEAVEAANRADCLSQMKARGITPMSVKEGRSSAAKYTKKDGRAGQRSYSHHSIFSHFHNSTIIASVLLVVLLGGGVWWWLGHSEAQPAPEPDAPKKPSALAKEVKPAAAPKPKAETVITNGRPETASQGNTEQPDRPFRRGSIDEITNLTCEAVTPEQKLYRKRLAALSNRVFKTASDQILAMAVGAEGAPMPPLPIGGDKMDEDFRRSLEVPIEILDSDPPSIRQLKTAVLEARAEMSRMLAKGYTVQEVLKEHMQLADENRKIRLDAERELRSIAESGDEESARRYANSVNAALQQMGIRPIDYGKSSAAQRRAEAMERRRAAKKAEQEKGDQR